MLSRTGVSYGFISIAGGGGKKTQKVSNGLCRFESKICFMLLLFLCCFIQKMVNFIIVVFFGVFFVGGAVIKTNNAKLASQAGIELSAFISFALFTRECYLYYFCMQN